MTTIQHSRSVLDAHRYVDPKGSPVASARLLAEAVISALANGGVATVRLVELRAATSSYFNELLSILAHRLGADVLTNHLAFEFATAAQKAIFDRSYDAVVKSLGR